MQRLSPHVIIDTLSHSVDRCNEEERFASCNVFFQYMLRKKHKTVEMMTALLLVVVLLLDTSIGTYGFILPTPTAVKYPRPIHAASTATDSHTSQQHNRMSRKLSMNALLPYGYIDYNVDVVVIGGGIAGSTISWLLQERHNCNVALIDPRADEGAGTWYPNYGEWRDEWIALTNQLNLPELRECTTTEWEKTDCFFGGSNGIPMAARTTLDRPYVRVDRIKMQRLLRSKYTSADGLALNTKLSATRISNNLFDKNLLHTSDGSILSLDNGKKLKCKVLIDASGLESKLVAREDPMYARGSRKELPTGFQIAYGFIAHVDSLGPYSKDAMTLFDYRTDHLSSSRATDGHDRPTFMYAMPLQVLEDGTHRVFFEETSLVGKDERRLSFDECKARALERLGHHKINVLGMEEEEYCYIPMGGELPDAKQRVIGFGGAANMVHPATGYHACRMLAASTELASVIGDNIDKSPDYIASLAHNSIWNEKNRGQRNFQAFGGDFLMQQPVDKLRGFFTAFFSIDQDVWSGFLAGWPKLPWNEYHETWYGRLQFALSLFLKMPNDVRLAMVLFSIKHSIQFGPNTLIRSLLPQLVLGDGIPGDAEAVWVEPPATLGDAEAKEEARRMMKAFKPSAFVTTSSSDGVAVKTTNHEAVPMPAPFN